MKRRAPEWDRTRGWGPWKEFWASICSRHQKYQEDCRLCKAGNWNNYWRWLFSSFIYKMSPKLWRWWANRKR